MIAEVLVGRHGKQNPVGSLKYLSHESSTFSIQEIEHDLWNLDLAAPPILLDIDKVDYVAQATKTGQLILLNRKANFELFFRVKRFFKLQNNLLLYKNINSTFFKLNKNLILGSIFFL